VPCAGIFAISFRCVMSKSCSPSAVWKRITRPSGVGFNVTAPNWISGCAVILSRPTNPGGLTRRIFECTAVGVTSTGPSIPPVPLSTSCSRRCAMPRRPNACYARRSTIHRWPESMGKSIFSRREPARRETGPPRSAGNDAEQNRLKPCRGKPFDLWKELTFESQKRNSRKKESSEGRCGSVLIL